MELEDLFDFNSDFLEDEEEQHHQDPIDDIHINQPKTPNTELFSLFFNCSGETSDLSSSIFINDLQSLMNHSKLELPSEIEFFDFTFDDENLPVDILIRMARQNIQKLATSTIDSYGRRVNSTFFELRESVTKLLICLRCNYHEISSKQLRLLRISFGTFDSMTNFSVIHSAFSSDGNSSTSSSYHLLHGMLEWRWIFITILYKIDFSQGVLGSDESEFAAELKLFIYDLLTLSISKFHKTNNASIIFTSPFICSCVKEMWIVVHHFVAQLQDKTFWSILSNIFGEIKDGKNPHDRFQAKKILLRSSSMVTCKNLDQFSIWFVCGLLKTVEIDSNDISKSRESYEFFENLVKGLLSTEQSEENMRILLVVISEVVFEVWPPKSEILLNFWEIFQRMINSPFFIAGQKPSVIAVSSASGAGYLQKIKDQHASTTKLNPNLTSYDMFVHLLGKMVAKFTQENQKNQVQRVLGRIYSKFPASKLQSLNEMGIHNLLKLFITLGISTNFSDIAKKVTETLLQIPIEKANHQQQLMKGHMAMLILHRENKMDVTQYATKLMLQVNSLSEKSGSGIISVLKIIADALPVIILQNSEDDDTFDNGEDILIDTWIVKYLTNGTIAEQDRVYESVTKIIQKIREARTKSLESANLNTLVEKLFKILLPHCKQVFGKIESSWLPTMVSNLCLLSAAYKYLDSKEIPKFETIFKYFIELNCVNIESSIKFLTIVMENSEKINNLDKLMVMQHWIKCSVLLSGGNSHLKDLTRCVMRFDDFTFLSETARNRAEDFLNSKEPLCTFITDVGKKYSDASNQVKFQLIEKIHSYFVNFEKWALPILQLQQQQQARTQSAVSTDESVMRIYTFISITIMHCSELIYIRSKSSCFFNVAISQFLLPASLMMGQCQPRSIIVSIYKVWPLLIDGIAKLDYKNDQHIAKVLNDVIVKWGPLLKISTNTKVVSKPFLNVTHLKNPEIIEFVYGKLAKNFIALQNRKPCQHACMILTMVEEVLNVIEGEEQKLMLVCRPIMPCVIEAAMMSDENIPSQTLSCNLLEKFVKNKNFDTSNGMRELMISSIQNSIQNQLSYYSAFCFRFLTRLSKFSPKIVSSLLPFLMAQIKKCEQVRGTGTDMKLRNLYDQLQKSLPKQ